MRSCDLRGNQTVSDCEDLRPPERHRLASMAWNLHAIEQMSYGDDVVGRPKFDFRTACDVASVSESFVARTFP